MAHSKTDIEHQVTKAVDDLRHTSALVSTLQRILEAQLTKLRVLRQEHKRYEELTQIEVDKVRPLLRQVETMLEEEQRRERWVALGMHLGFGLLFFVLGVALSDSLRLWINRVWSELFR